ncbi:hypothetical protein FB45DRAFT_1118084 [Roridomyces roridus]|uniref:F-box domain-containing protein n=1 Tax=Roridomyces roridus TaxID=1738132 RepID=A0AAD7FCK4_9AGAR|nr:hypothetical protein FB45DRAFT_1118084 [Roridomyces roridus]
MVLTRSGNRARMQITRWLPNEVLVHIIQSASMTDRAVLSRVSKLFHALSLPIVNRRICLDTAKLDSTIIVVFCNSMIQNPERATATREMTVIDPEQEQANYGPIFNTMKLMLKLEDLSLLEYTDGLSSVCSRVSDLTFPNLSGYRLGIKSGDEENDVPILKFLARHPNLTHLRVWVSGFNEIEPAPSSRLRFPKLRHYEGTSGLPAYIVTESLKRARISAWGWDALENEQIVESLRSLTDPNVPFILSNDYHALDNEDGLSMLRESLMALSSRMPYIMSLQVRSATTPIDSQILETITGTLEPFEHLVCLAATHAPDVDPAPQDRDAWRLTLETWANLCPNLRLCCIVDSAWLKGEEEWVEIAKSHFFLFAGFAVFDYEELLN